MAVTRTRPRTRQVYDFWKRAMVVVLRRPERVACAHCHASHPAIYNGQQCLICGSKIDTASGHRNDVGATVSTKRKAKEAEKYYTAQFAALRSERDKLRAALQAARSEQDFVHVSDYEWYVELAGKGLAQRDKFPMPPSVTTPEGFYEIMAGAALNAMGLRALLRRMTRAEQDLEIIQDALRQADTKTESARHRRC